MTTFAKAITAAAALAALASHPVAAGDLTLGGEGGIGLQPPRTPLTRVDEPALRALTPLSDAELDAVEGHGFPFRFRFDIAIVPQINICLFCNGVTQSNQVYIFRLFERP